jgi:hypothetical protein
VPIPIAPSLRIIAKWPVWRCARRRRPILVERGHWASTIEQHALAGVCRRRARHRVDLSPFFVARAFRPIRAARTPVQPGLFKVPRLRPVFRIVGTDVNKEAGPVLPGTRRRCRSLAHVRMRRSRAQRSPMTSVAAPRVRAVMSVGADCRPEKRENRKRDQTIQQSARVARRENQAPHRYAVISALKGICRIP